MRVGWVIAVLVVSAAPGGAASAQPGVDPSVTRALIDARMAREQQKADDARRAEADATRRKIGALLADGRCDDARRAALQAGDFDLAQRTAALCVQPAPKPAAAN